LGKVGKNFEWCLLGMTRNYQQAVDDRTKKWEKWHREKHTGTAVPNEAI